ncbi:MAG TPA: NAD-dependent epimerase/dehydratase family protein [Phycisphaerales bacterium]|nr:NAD-dependent epimerase/dehydratase family protein [Phycisphaerales bacterium]
MAQNTQPIVVTGAAGFIGSSVAAALLARGERVVGVDNFDPYYSRSTKEANLARLACPAFEAVEMDIRDDQAMAGLFGRRRPAGVVHLAARAGVRPSVADPVGYASANVLGTAGVLRAAERAGCTRVVLASSSSVYGNNRKTPFSEEDPVESPISPYASTKRCCELIAHTHHHLTGMPTACLRFFTVYGPGQRPDLGIATFMRLMREGKPIVMFGDGSMSRDYTFIEDTVRGVLAAYDRISAHGYRVWNLGSDRPVRLDALIDEIAAIAGLTPRIERADPPKGDVERTWADLTRAKAELGYAPSTPLRAGLMRQWAACSGERGAADGGSISKG